MTKIYFQIINGQRLISLRLEGNYLTDTTGKTYLDFSSGIGVTNLGYHSPCQSGFDRAGGQDFASA